MHCVVFEPDDINTSENEHEYKKIFEDFKNLVDFMLGNFMEDIGITPEQFEEACNRGNYEPVPVHFDQNLFEQIWAANDYEIFKRMMTQRNVELQLQALELIEQKYGITPESFIPKKKQDSKEEVLKSPSLEVHVMEDVVKYVVFLKFNKFPKSSVLFFYVFLIFICVLSHLWCF